jgi:oxepin-CoA hydrolase/3-oxo-5,6-dehydrosuberyl-CoA semialdehyde dehydrogenase
MKLPNFIQGNWVPHDGEGIPQYDAVSGELIATCGSEGLDYASIFSYGREKGGRQLRKMTFHERGLMLKKLALFLHSIRKKYYPLSYRTGATKTDSWVDIDGGIGTLFAYASLRRQFPDLPFHIDGDTIKTSREGTFVAQHIMVPRQGIAIHINAFNFPVWGMLEKISVNLLAGMPAVVKASEVTSFLTQAMVKDIIDSGILPEGALQFIGGGGIGILDAVDSQDVVTFTGSASTGKMLKSMPSLVEHAVPFNMEADSLNAAVLAPDAQPGTPIFDLFVKEVRKEIVSKAGQKCTAIRRVIVPETLIEAVSEALAAQLDRITIGNPQSESVRMGSLVSKDQLREVSSSMERLKAYSRVIYEGKGLNALIDADAGKGAFFNPVVLYNDKPFEQTGSHEIEAFGPVCTLMPYREMEEAIAITRLGKGSLVSTLATADMGFAGAYVLEAAAYHGRIHLLNEQSAPESTGHGSPLPLLVHGGPGRAGGGAELGGVRGVKHYLQTTALQGDPGMLTAVTGVYQYGAPYLQKPVHPFRKHFEELEIGETWITHKHTVSETDIVNFANVSGDNFYAHMDATSLEGTLFEKRVAHGYFVLSKAAGLFVDPAKGPVLLNYGLDNCRFTKPVYPGMTIGVRLTVREKVAQEKRDENDIRKGIVKYLVDVYDETGETVAIATILTMVKMLNQDN